jgi:predicted DNA-binding transcriptional regulator YafY
MSRRESLSRFSLIIKKLRRSPSTFKEIEESFKIESELQAYDFTISKRTFQRDLDDIRSLFNIDIQYDFSKKEYFIESDLQPEVNERIFEAFDTFNALNLTDRLSNYIHFEKRRPQGTENLYGLLHSIQNHNVISFTYHKYWEDDISIRKVEPYALKEFKNRWYLVANDLKDKMVKTFALDRLTDLEISKKRFTYPKEFSVSEHFRHSFGIISSNDGDPQEVILSFDPFQGKYIKSLPLHESQEIIVDNEDELVVKLTLFLTYDLLMEILSYGEDVKVIQPDCLIVEIKNSYQNSLKHY